MRLQDLLNKKIAIFGYGAEGKSLAEYLSSHGIKDFVVFDERINEGPRLVAGPFKKESFVDIDVAFRSPGIDPQSVHDLVPEGTKITSLTNLFFANHRGKIVAVTGTKGKSTTVSLVAQILKQNGLKYFVGGNIGTPPLEYLDETTDDSYSILELSSFQTEDLEYAPDYAVYLPISSDHLDFHENQGKHFNVHKSQESYISAKGQLAKGMKGNSLIIAYVSEQVISAIADSAAKKIFFSDAPLESGCFLLGEKIRCILEGKESEFDNVRALSCEKKVPAVNVLAAVTFGRALDMRIDIEAMLNDLKKLPYRIEFVGEANSVKFYNDSAATNPVSTIAAMKTMADKYVLICGGSRKGLNFDELAKEAIKDRNLTKIYLYGQTAEEIADELDEADFQKPIEKRKNLEEAMRDVVASPGDFQSVLFSPASASFDQFKNYLERGKKFEVIVKNLKNGRLS